MYKRITLPFLVFINGMSGCGGSSNSNIPAFPESLPDINPALSTETPAGIWMVERITTSRTDYTDEDGKDRRAESSKRYTEFVIIDESETQEYLLGTCSSAREWNQEPVKKHFNSGYQLSETINTTLSDYSNKEIYRFIDNVRIYGSGTAKERTDGSIFTGVADNTDYRFTSNTEVFAVKISDKTQFSEARELRLQIDSRSHLGSYQDTLHCADLFELTDSQANKASSNTRFTAAFEKHGAFSQIYTGSLYESNILIAYADGISINDIFSPGEFQYYERHCEEGSGPECFNRQNTHIDIQRQDSSGMTITSSSSSTEENDQWFLELSFSIDTNF